MCLPPGVGAVIIAPGDKIKGARTSPSVSYGPEARAPVAPPGVGAIIIAPGEGTPPGVDKEEIKSAPQRGALNDLGQQIRMLNIEY